MVGLCEGGNEPSGSLKAICKGLFDAKDQEEEVQVNVRPIILLREECDTSSAAEIFQVIVNCPKTGLNLKWCKQAKQGTTNEATRPGDNGVGFQFLSHNIINF
ncbi:hypothetical protein ANN_22978 [Periplaneta americana]|uniref:Uncharacterized protein n=1 Tax=Periplaneta americana TaxID=6978 RepID=A0ABQ8SL04_PERAM|nr:hypothetical protein ANN_22978 [Periplaneta americana]